MIDRYTKIVLTIIATSLVALVFQNLSQSALAQGSDPCGSSPQTACWIQATASHPVYVQADPRTGIYVTAVYAQPLEVRVVR